MTDHQLIAEVQAWLDKGPVSNYRHIIKHEPRKWDAFLRAREAVKKGDGAGAHKAMEEFHGS